MSASTNPFALYVTQQSVALLEESLWEAKENKAKKSWVREIASNLFIELEVNDGLTATNVRLTGGSDSGASSTVQSPTASSASGPVDREPTHRGLYKFIARHLDEIEIEIGDPIFVEREDEDLWCSGINLRSGAKGIFPSMVITDVQYADLLATEPQSSSQSSIQVKKERYLMIFLGSIEVYARKGNQVIREAIQRIEHASQTNDMSRKCVLEVSDQGVRLNDVKQEEEYFFKLKDITFCGFHEKDYFAFITKHPKEKERFACHVFKGEQNCRDVAESIGRAFTRFYQHFMDATSTH